MIRFAILLLFVLKNILIKILCCGKILVRCKLNIQHKFVKTCDYVLETMHTLFSRVFTLLKFASQLEYAFFVRSFGCAFFVLWGKCMTEKDYIESYIKAINEREERSGKYTEPWKVDDNTPEDNKGTLGLLRELYTYKKMYERLHNTVIDIIRDYKDIEVKEKLTKCLINTEQLYVTQGILPPDYMFAEELIIAYLLVYIRKNEIKVPAEYGETAFFKESLDWLKDLSAKDELSRALFKYANSLDDWEF